MQRMNKIRAEIMLEHSNYLWLLEDQAIRRQKNLSETINEALRNYQNLVRSMRNAHNEREIQEKKQKEAEAAIQSYRNQVISKD